VRGAGGPAAAVAAGDEAAQTVKDETGVGEKPPSDPEALRAEIAETREELGQTVEALSAKADVKGQVSDKVDERKEAIKGKADELKSKVSGAAGQAKGATPDDAKRVAGQAQAKAEERPMPAIAGAFAAGLVIGLVIGRR